MRPGSRYGGTDRPSASRGSRRVERRNLGSIWPAPHWGNPAGWLALTPFRSSTIHGEGCDFQVQLSKSLGGNCGPTSTGQPGEVVVARGSPVSSGTRRKAVQRCPLLVELPTEQLSRSVGALPRSVGCYPGPSAPGRRYGFGGKAELFQPEPGCIPWRAAPKPTLELRTTPLSLSPPPLERPCAWPGSPTHWLLRSALSTLWFGDDKVTQFDHGERERSSRGGSRSAGSADARSRCPEPAMILTKGCTH